MPQTIAPAPLSDADKNIIELLQKQEASLEEVLSFTREQIALIRERCEHKMQRMSPAQKKCTECGLYEDVRY